jgi:hypothetical protein
MKTKKQEFQAHLDVIFKILQMAKENFSYCQYLYEPVSISEREYITIDRHLQFIRFSLWQITIIELNKLISESSSHKFNFYSLIKNLKHGGHYSSFRVSESNIIAWENVLLLHEGLTAKVKRLRDKLYAHTDRITEELKSTSIILSDISNLILVLQNLLNTIGQTTLQLDYVFSEVYFNEDDFDLVKILAEEHKREIEFFDGLLSKK